MMAWSDTPTKTGCTYRTANIQIKSKTQQILAQNSGYQLRWFKHLGIGVV